MNVARKWEGIHDGNNDDDNKKGLSITIHQKSVPLTFLTVDQTCYRGVLQFCVFLLNDKNMNFALQICVENLDSKEMSNL